MPTPPIPTQKARDFIDTIETLLACGYAPRGVTPPKGRRGAAAEAAVRMGYAANSMNTNFLDRIEHFAGRKIKWNKYRPDAPEAPAAVKAKVAPVVRDDGAVRAELMRRSISMDDLAAKMGMDPHGGHSRSVHTWIGRQREAGINIHVRDGMVSIDRTHQSALVRGRDPLVIESDAKGRYRLGLTGDNHLGSKYARLDVLGDLYDRFAREGIRTVLNTGNWIDGEARFNTHDLLVHGFEAQLRYLAEHYPQRKGIDTHAVWGDDHEGWYGQKFGVDVGVRAQQMMRDAGRKDWHDLGFMESDVILRNRQSGAEAVMRVMHPGGGSAYATSYTMQKLVESFDGGEKPAVLAAGHYHKLEVLNVRNVWCIQTGCTQDQTPFMRKKKLEAHVGGVVLDLEQDPRTGAIITCNGQQRYFVQGYYNGRWSPSQPAVHARRAPA